MTYKNEKHYWRCPDDPAQDGVRRVERCSDVEEVLSNTPEGVVTRRNFLRASGFSLGLIATAAGCQRAPVIQALPYLTNPEGVVPGKAQWYATVCAGCEAGCGALVKVRDGRPIKMEGNPAHPISQGGLCAQGQAFLLGLYDAKRFSAPQIDGNATRWETIDSSVRTELDRARQTGGKVAVLSRTLHSPTERAALQQFLSTLPNAQHVAYDVLSCSALAAAHEITHGIRTIPHYRFDRAEIVVGFDADFLGTWISPVEFTAAYAQRRRLETANPVFLHHVQFEPCMTLTGAKADVRLRVAPDEFWGVIGGLASRIARTKHQDVPVSLPDAPTEEQRSLLDRLAEQLIQRPGRSLVVCGCQDVVLQVLCNLINEWLGNYPNTVDIAQPSLQRQGDEVALRSLVTEMAGGRVSVLILYGVNPLYDLPKHLGIAEALQKVPFTIALAERPDETTARVRAVAPLAHPLESWSDAEPVRDVFSVRQPVIRPLFGGRTLTENLSAWLGEPVSAYESVRRYWQEVLCPRAQTDVSFEVWWHQILHEGLVRLPGIEKESPTFRPEAALAVLKQKSAPPSDGYMLRVYAKVGFGDGRHAYNPWLQELPDPISKVTWDNYACLSPAAAKRLGVGQGDVLRLEFTDDQGEAHTVELPALLQPGQHDRVIAIALGYGGEVTRRFAEVGPDWIGKRPTVNKEGMVGVRVADALGLREGILQYDRPLVKVSKTGAKALLACTQLHHSLTVPKHLAPAQGETRPIIQETTLAAWQKDPGSGKERVELPEKDLYPPEDHPYTGHRWGMAIDLTLCTGCSACVVACQAENNIPVVGKDEVYRQREMHWLRIDRYYSGESEDVDVAYMPMLCQHCTHASCENVCPVLATVHTEEGLNAQVYNRCVGTRYCANNCAYKVRRFNWFQYRHDDPVENLVLNPDVTVRSRGVMEKCSFCIQRIQEAKIEAKRRGTPLADGVIQPACQQSCPAGAIVFGDLNDPNSRVSALAKSGRAYRVLEELNTQPAVTYLTLVRNREETPQGRIEHHG